MVTGPLSPPVDPNLPKEASNLIPSAWLIFKKEKGLKGNVQKQFKALSESEKKKYRQKAKKNREEKKAILKKYKETWSFKRWSLKYKEWEKKIEEYYPPKPKGKDMIDEMKIWEKQCRQIKATLRLTGTLENTKWMEKHKRRMAMGTPNKSDVNEVIDDNKSGVNGDKTAKDHNEKKMEKGIKEQEKEKKNDLKAITKEVKVDGNKTAKKEKNKKGAKKGQDVKKEQLKAITKGTKEVKVNGDKKNGGKGARKLNDNKKGDKIEKKVKKQQAQKKKKGKNKKGKSGVKKA